MKLIKEILLLSVACTISSFADMGSIPFKQEVRIIEPTQDAIIAWNGKEQLLYLQTTLGASQETKVLEVMPLPSKPTVEATGMEVFHRCQALLPRLVVRDYGRPAAFGGGDYLQPAAQVVEQKTIGAHDIRIVELLDAGRFSAWVTSEFGGDNDGLEVPQPLLAVIADYARDGYGWFLFDVVDVGQELAKKTPLRIRFETDVLYYPMRITRTEKGYTTVSLSVLTNVLFNKEDCIGIPREAIKVPMQPIKISDVQLNWIDPAIWELLGRPGVVQLRSWKISGEIDSFQQDLLVRMPAAIGKDGARGRADQSASRPGLRPDGNPKR